ncbi:polymerase [Sporolactobacillus sp. Y61]|uniref:Polymerase n=1 Tax=Sporolactobacillus sp. Y61 TaxID=3160863 RepID=A0AAU8IIK6_9BACL
MNEERLISARLKKPVRTTLVIISGLVIGTLSALLQFNLFLITSGIFLILVFIHWKNVNKFAYLLLIMIVFQNFFAIILSGLNRPFFVTLLISIKELYVYTCILLFSLLKKRDRSKKLNMINWISYTYLFCILFYFIWPDQPDLFVKGVSGRQLIMPVILYLFGYYVVSCKDKLLYFYIKISLLIVSFGFIETWVLGDKFWISLGIKSYMENKGMSLWAYGTQGLPGNFYTFDFSSFIGTSLRRMVSFIADPTLLGQFLVIPVLYSILGDFYKKSRIRKLFYMTFLTTGLVMTLSKGGLLSVAIGILFCLIFQKNRSSQLVGLFISYILFFFVLFIFSNYQKFASLPAHINGLVSNLAAIVRHPFGSGLGRSGNFANLYNERANSMNMNAGESYIGTMVGQTGLVVTALFLVFIALIISGLLKQYKEGHEKNSLILAGALSGTVMVSFLSESAISFISSGFIFVMAGAYLSERNVNIRRDYH